MFLKTMNQLNSEIKIQYILYGTSACYLCELAETMIIHASQAHGIGYEYIDIAENEILLEKYGITIPVFKCIESRQELNWPFTKVMLKSFIDRQ